MKKPKEFDLKSYLKNAIRRASYRYPSRTEAMKLARRVAPKDWPNKRVQYVAQCAECGKLFELKEVQADHIEPIIPVSGWPDAPKSDLYDWRPGLPDWNVCVYRCFVKPTAYRILCKQDHSTKTKKENAERREAKKRAA